MPSLAAVCQSHLFPWILWMFLEGPGDSGLKRFRDALQKSAASLHTEELLLRHAMLVVVCRGQQREGGCWGAQQRLKPESQVSIIAIDNGVLSAFVVSHHEKIKKSVTLRL